MFRNRNADQETPEQVLRRVTEEFLGRAIRLGRKNGRSLSLSKTSRGRGVPVERLDPSTAAGRAELDRFFARPARHYTFSGLGAPEEPNAINWRTLTGSGPQRALRLAAVVVSLGLKGTPAKNRFLRWMGVHVGKNVEIMQMVWLDHFRPELIFLGDDCLLGAFTRVTVHAYEGHGRFRFGLVELGRGCKLGAGTGLGVCKLGDGVRTLPGTTVSPYYPRIQAGATVGYAPPPLTLPGRDTSGAASRSPAPPAGDSEESDG
jgi:hypothetical protein